ncbi:zinc-ribbon domain-containing protein [Psychrobacillus sp. MER TA 17]|nr:zinc-ribbon domain-containing protein [Psychrobacillus sp. MER TA 17]
MAIKEDHVEVTLNGRSIAHYESLGYRIERRHNGWTHTVPYGTKIVVKVTDLTPGSNVKLTKICDRCSTEIPNKTYNAIIRGRKNGEDLCRRCSNRLSKTKEENLLINVKPEVARSWDKHKNTYDLGEITVYSSIKAWWICGACSNSWRASVADRSNGKGCPSCRMSKGEQEIRSYLIKNNIKFIPQHKFKGLVGLGGGHLLFDFYLPDLEIVVEFDGEQHFRPVSFNNYQGLANSEFKIIQKHDAMKNEFCRKSGLKLLRIPYYEFENIESILNNNINSEPSDESPKKAAFSL